MDTRYFSRDDFEAATPEQTERVENLLEDYSDVQLSKKSMNLALHFLEESFIRHGDIASDSYKEHHNDLHSLDVLKRSWKIWKLLSEVMPERADEHMYELLLLASTGHDIVYEQNRNGNDLNESDSAEYVAQYMREYGYSDVDIERVYDAIMCTAVSIDSAGMVSQYNLTRGSKDPMKIVLATADISGIAFEGIARLEADALNIQSEMSQDNPTIEKGIKMLQYQEQFLRYRIKEAQIALKWYFTDQEVENINNIYQQNFADVLRSVLDYAKELASDIHVAENAINKALGVSENVKIIGVRSLRRIRKKAKKIHEK